MASGFLFQTRNIRRLPENPLSEPPALPLGLLGGQESTLATAGRSEQGDVAEGREEFPSGRQPSVSSELAEGWVLP